MDNTGAQFTMINALRTGNVILDMGIAMAAPAAIRAVCDSECLQKVKRYFFPRPSRFETGGAVRSITSRTSRRFSQDQQDQVLLRAIKLYLQHLQIDLPGRAQVQLTALADGGANATPHATPHAAHRSSNADPAANHRLTWLAAENEWVDIGNGISFRHFQRCSEATKEQQGGEKPDPFTVFELSSKAADGAARVDAFINAALDWYRAEEVGRMKDSRRWIYTMAAKRLRPNPPDEMPDFRYKRHLLTDSKQFANLFFPQKEALLRLLHDFERKEGKYAISGFPHKVGLLLHGPPGTGKTSMIKALAQHTGRSIINVSLAQIETNAELEAIMYDLNVDVIGGGDTRAAKRLSFSDVIFVLEDVDACSHVVRRRDPPRRVRDTCHIAEPPPGARTPSPSSSSFATPPYHGPSPPHFPSAMEQPPTLVPPPPFPPPGYAPPAPYPPLWPTPHPDALNLSGLLNVLDGVVETPGRMLVMTSNHPESLDPALIRPGRIDRCLLLGYLQTEDAAHMLEHYFGGALSGEERESLGQLMGGDSERGLQMTPAEMEQLCAEHDSVRTLLGHLGVETALRSAEHEFEGARATKRARPNGTP